MPKLVLGLIALVMAAGLLLGATFECRRTEQLRGWYDLRTEHIRGDLGL